MSTQFFNHCWQSSCFVLAAAVLAFLLRKHSPAIRYWVWFSASVKFLVPFALLVSLGSLMPRPARPTVDIATPVFSDTLVEIAEPYSPADVATVPSQAPISWPLVLSVVVRLRLEEGVGERAREEIQIAIDGAHPRSAQASSPRCASAVCITLYQPSLMEASGMLISSSGLTA